MSRFKRLESIQEEYCKTDESVQKLIKSGVPGITMVNGLVYAGSCFVVPKVLDVRENLLKMVHDVLGSFGYHKSYMVLRDCYYRPGMQKDLKTGYIPGCTVSEEQVSNY